MPLSDSQKKHLRRLAHDRKPIVIIGDLGLKETVLLAVEEALEFHELIKIKVNVADKDARQVMLESVCQTTRCQLVQHIGFIAILYRRNKQSPKLVLNAKNIRA